MLRIYINHYLHNDYYAKLLKMRHCMKDKTKRLRINWYKLLYSTGDKVLIDMFWVHFKKHRISKNRCARCVLLHYYSTASVTVPAEVAAAFTFYRDRKAAQFNVYDNGVDLESLS